MVILNWNGLAFLKRFLGEVVRTTTIPGSSVWVVDNGSDDGSADWITTSFPTVRTLLFTENYGYAGGYAKALDQIEARYFVLINSDIEVTEGWLEPLYKLMETDPKIAACQPKILSLDERNRFEHAGAAGGFIDKFGYPFCRGRILHVTEADNGQYDKPSRIMWASGACFVIRSDAYRQAGGLDSSFFAHMEEIDLCWRLSHYGFECWSVPSSVVYHIGGGTLGYKSPAKTYLNFRNNLFMLYKNLPAKGFRKKLIIRKLLDGVAALMFLIQGKPWHFTSVFRAHRDYYRASGNLKNERKRIASDVGQKTLPCNIMLNKSILFLFYFRGVRKYGELSF